MKLNRRSFWGLFAGLVTAPFLSKSIPTYNNDEWVYHPLRREHQDVLLRSLGTSSKRWSSIYSTNYTPHTSAACKERCMFDRGTSQQYLDAERRHFFGLDLEKGSS